MENYGLRRRNSQRSGEKWCRILPNRVPLQFQDPLNFCSIEEHQLVKENIHLKRILIFEKSSVISKIWLFPSVDSNFVSLAIEWVPKVLSFHPKLCSTSKNRPKYPNLRIIDLCLIFWFRWRLINILGSLLLLFKTRSVKESSFLFLCNQSWIWRNNELSISSYF